MTRPALLLLALLVLLGLLALGVGELHLTPRVVLSALAGRGDELARTVVWNLRLPRLLIGATAGAALAASGVVMQAYFRNPLANPGLLGVSAGGALGAVSAIALGWTAGHFLALPVASLLGAFLATWAVLAMAKGGAGTDRLLLTGVALNALLGAATSFMLTLGANAFDRTANILFWLLGGLEDRTWEHVAMGVPGILAGCLLLLPLGRAMNLLSLGEDSAQSLGVDIRRLRRELIALSTLLTALATAVAGTVGFVGLVVPHLLRLSVGPDHRRLLPLSMLGGAAFVLTADLACRLLPGGVRLGILTALVGGPFFLWLLRRKA